MWCFIFFLMFFIKFISFVTRSLLLVWYLVSNQPSHLSLCTWYHHIQDKSTAEWIRIPTQMQIYKWTNLSSLYLAEFLGMATGIEFLIAKREKSTPVCHEKLVTDEFALLRFAVCIFFHFACNSFWEVFLNCINEYLNEDKILWHDVLY